MSYTKTKASNDPTTTFSLQVPSGNAIPRVALHSTLTISWADQTWPEVITESFHWSRLNPLYWQKCPQCSESLTQLVTEVPYDLGKMRFLREILEYIAQPGFQCDGELGSGTLTLKQIELF